MNKCVNHDAESTRAITRALRRLQQQRIVLHRRPDRELGEALYDTEQRGEPKQEPLEHVREIRDEIGRRVEELTDELDSNEGSTT